MLMSGYHFLLFARSGTMDVASTMFMTGAIYFFVKNEAPGPDIMTAFLLFSLAFLTKSFVALLVPAILGTYVILTGKWKMVFNRYCFFGAVAALFLVGIWHYAAFMSGGGHFIGGYINQHLFERTTKAMDGHVGSWVTYINVMLYKAKPWGAAGIVFLPFMIIAALKKGRSDNWLFVIWILTVYVVFTLVKTKLHWYIIPVYPALMLVAAWGVEKIFRRFAVGIVCVIAFIGVMYFGAKKEVFSMDFNPEIKHFAREVDNISRTARINGKVYALDLNDPGIIFYLSDIYTVIDKDKYGDLAGEKNYILVGRNEDLAALKVKGKIVLSCRNDFSAVMVE